MKDNYVQLKKLIVNELQYLEMDPDSCKIVQSDSVKLSPDQDALQTHLDSLIVSYLDLIDTYTQLQKDLSQNLSSGFLSIAQANFSSNTGRRYGEDFYDERMKAMKGVEISSENGAKFPDFKLVHIPLEGEEIIISEKEGDPEKNKASGVRRRKAAQEESQDNQTHSSNKDDETQGIQTEYKHTSQVVMKDPRDPIKWFGILVPPALKDAQLRFSNALSRIPDLVTLLKDLNWHEEEIRKLRQQIDDDRVHDIGEKLVHASLADTTGTEKDSPSTV